MEKKFIKWLSGKKEFKNMPKEKLIELVNALAEKNPEKMEELVSEFKKELKYAVGGKIAYLVSKMNDGGEITDDETWREDPMDGDIDLDSTPVKPTVEPPKVVSRQQYRINMYNSRQQHPEWTRRQRKAWSLLHTGKPEPINYESDQQHIYTDDEEDVVITSPQPAKPATATPALHPNWLVRAKRFGFKSIDEVRKWQQANGLVADGKFGKNSEAKWRSLQSPQGGATPAGSSASYWDMRAKNAGFASIDALKQWQAANGLVADGKFGANSEAKLRALQAQQGAKHKEDMEMANLHADAAQQGYGHGPLRPMTGDQYALYNQEMARRAQEEANRKKAEEEKRKADAEARAAEDIYYNTQALYSPYRYIRN